MSPNHIPFYWYTNLVLLGTVYRWFRTPEPLYLCPLGIPVFTNYNNSGFTLSTTHYYWTDCFVVWIIKATYQCEPNLMDPDYRNKVLPYLKLSWDWWDRISNSSTTLSVIKTSVLVPQGPQFFSVVIKGDKSVNNTLSFECRQQSLG